MARHWYARLTFRGFHLHRGHREASGTACIEEIAYKRGWITKEQLRKLAEPMAKNDYGKYLLNISK